MKKRLFYGCLVLFATMALASCDDLNLNVGEITQNDLAGSASLNVTRNTTDGPVTDSMHFISSIVDAFELSMFDTNLSEGFSTIGISANIGLGESGAELQFPFMYYRLNDTVQGVYPFDTILTLEMLQSINFEALVDILANPDGGNMIVIAVSDSCWYITYGGDFVVTEFPGVGHLVKAEFNGVNALYVTQSKVEELGQDIDNMNYSHMTDIDYYFPRVTISGNVKSRRWAVTKTIFNAAFQQGGIVSK